jgi:hypothetical protein
MMSCDHWQKPYFPNKVTLEGTGGQDSTSLGRHNSTHNRHVLPFSLPCFLLHRMGRPVSLLIINGLIVTGASQARVKCQLLANVLSVSSPGRQLDYFFETGSHYVAQASLELKILLPHPPECWDYRCVL